MIDESSSPEPSPSDDKLIDDVMLVVMPGPSPSP
jgi:hypothetical protein